MTQGSLGEPRYTLTTAIARDLMTIEAARAVVAHTPLPPAVEAELRHRARVRSTHFSTRIEGNRLTLEEAARVIEGAPEPAGRARDAREVRNYWNALAQVEQWGQAQRSLTEFLIRRLHALVEHGLRARPTAYRTGQNVIRDSQTGGIVYLPPEAPDVPALMAALVAWVGRAEKAGLPVPLVAALVHYQFVTIHPYYDGNGRTARLLATFILQRGGYGLNGFFSLEEHHARDLERYYTSLVTHPHHNYYGGRADADLTGWLSYFTATLARVFGDVQAEALRVAAQGEPPDAALLARLDPRARRILGLLARYEQVTTAQIARELAVAPRTARELIHAWVKEGWLAVVDPANRSRRYGLSAEYRRVIGGLSAE